MGLKGKLIAILEVKCEGHFVHDIFHTNARHVGNISPRVVNHFEIHESEIGKVGAVLGWKYNEDGNKKFAKVVIEVSDLQKKSITWKVIEGDLLELYNSFTINSSFDHQWATLTFVYEKKTEDASEPLGFSDCFLDAIKDIEDDLLIK